MDRPTLYSEATAPGIVLNDDSAREGALEGRYDHDTFAGVATDGLGLFLNELGKYPLLTTEEEVDLAKRIERGDNAAKDKMILSNLRLVVWIAKRYRSDQLALLDLIQEGVLGLMRATEKFDWRRGYKFSTYSTRWIRQAVERGIQNKARTVRMPVYVLQRERRIDMEERRLVVSLGRLPTDEEIAGAVRLPLEQVREIRASPRTVTSLDRPVGTEGGTTLGELLECSGSTPEETVDVSLRKEALRHGVSELPELERKVMKLRYGLNGDVTPRSVRELTAKLGIPARQIRRLEAKGLARLGRMRGLQGLRE